MIESVATKTFGLRISIYIFLYKCRDYRIVIMKDLTKKVQHTLPPTQNENCLHSLQKVGFHNVYCYFFVCNTDHNVELCMICVYKRLHTDDRKKMLNFFVGKMHYSRFMACRKFFILLELKVQNTFFIEHYFVLNLSKAYVILPKKKYKKI